jgi:type VII secretion protein EccB
VLTRRDQLQSYQFGLQRVVSALVMRETDPLTPPFRRFLIAGWSSLVAASLVLAACGIYGLLRPGGKESWRHGDKVILERETGAQYVYRDGRLYRVANHTSGVLLLGKDAGTVTVTRRSLLDVPRGPEVGIAGAPDGLPAPDALLRGPWTLCSTVVTDDTGTDLAATMLIVGGRAEGGAPVADRALLLQNIEDGKLYLLVAGHRHEITDTRAALVGLALGQQPRVRVGSAWLDGVPAGVPVAPPPVDGRGRPSAFRGALVGQLLVVPGPAEQYFVAVADGLLSVSPLQYALLSAAEATERAYPGGPVRAREIRAAEAAAAVLPTEPPAGPEQLPATRPELADAPPGGVVCAAVSGLDGTPEVSVGARLPVSTSDLVTARRSRGGTVVADRVLIPGGHGAIVESVQGHRGPGTLQLVTEQGVRHPLVSDKVLSVLGYPTTSVVRLPAEVVARVPEGVPLDPAAAGTVLLQN